MKRKLVYFFLIVIAILVGHYVGNLFANDATSILSWLGNYLRFGFDSVELNMSVMQLSLGLHFRINFLQIILIAIAIFITPKVSDAIK